MNLQAFFSILLGIAFSLSSRVFAGENITQTDYTIDLSRMDPVSHGSGGGAAIVGGKGAIMMILQNLSEILLFMIPIIAGVSLIVAGYYYIFSSGDTEKTNQGKTIIKWNIVAMLVAFFSWTLVKLIATLFS